MTHRERMLMAARGRMPDIIPYAPRFDLWYNSNDYRRTMPKKYEGLSLDEIARLEGWGLHKIVPEMLAAEKPEDNIYRGIGLYALKEYGRRIEFSSNVEIKVDYSSDGTEDLTRVEYHTPLGVITTVEVFTEEMRKAGISITWLKERAIKSIEDFKILAYLFEQIRIVPDYDRFSQWQATVGDEGLVCLTASFAASPMQYIQRDFLDSTEFFFHYNDNQKQMRHLAEAVEYVLEQCLSIAGNSPAEVVHWGSNYDEMITYPPYFEREILPWLQKASTYFLDKGKLLLSHTDGENKGLIKLIARSGIHIAEAVCPAPMTKVPLDTYYDLWSQKNDICIFGGVPQSLLSTTTATEEELIDYMNYLIKAIAPGSRFIVGVADTTPPDADFNRLKIIGEIIAEKGRLPLEAGGFRYVSMKESVKPQKLQKTTEIQKDDNIYEAVQEDVLKGDHMQIKVHVRELLDKGRSAQDILHIGMLSAMDIIGEKFRDGSVFIPEVLLSARAMNEAVTMMEPYLVSGESKKPGKILIGTVQGDMHDIGKNIVITMLRGSGFEVIDLGMDVNVQVFLNKVMEYQPDVLALSALLTTTMPKMRNVIDTLVKEGIRDKLKVIVGGAPINKKFADEIGADGYAPDAVSAVDLVRKLM